MRFNFKKNFITLKMKQTLFWAIHMGAYKTSLMWIKLVVKCKNLLLTLSKETPLAVVISIDQAYAFPFIDGQI
jgi:hypothetical protein